MKEGKLQSVMIHRKSDLCLSKAYNSVHDHLLSISSRESEYGVPVGVLLITRAYCGVFKQEWESHFKASCEQYKIGFQKVLPVCSDPSLAIIHLSSRTVMNFVRIEWQKLWVEKPVEFFTGVRLCDVEFGCKKYRETQNIYFSDCDIQKDLKCSPQQPSSKCFTFAEVFAGIGGFRLGLEKLGGQCVFSSELDADARHTMELNFGKDGLCGDITAIYGHQLPVCDLLTAGFPCQPFSERGDQKGFDDLRGQLYRELIRIMKTSVEPPKAVLFENVIGLVTLGGGRRNKKGEPENILQIGSVFASILDEFSAAGYDVLWKIIDAGGWVPQHRERVYIVGFLKDLHVNHHSFEWPLEAHETCNRIENVDTRKEDNNSPCLELSKSRKESEPIKPVPSQEFCKITSIQSTIVDSAVPDIIHAVPEDAFVVPVPQSSCEVGKETSGKLPLNVKKRSIKVAFQDRFQDREQNINVKHSYITRTSDIHNHSFKSNTDNSTASLEHVYNFSKNSTVRSILESQVPHHSGAIDCINQNHCGALTERQWARIQDPEYKNRTSQWGRLAGQERSREIPLDGKAPTLTSGYRNAFNVATRFIFEEADGTKRELPRFLTPRECCRLMGFPESFVIPPPSVKNSGDENRFYHQIGNAVCPPVIEAIGHQIIQVLQDADAWGNSKNCSKHNS